MRVARAPPPQVIQTSLSPVPRLLPMKPPDGRHMLLWCRHGPSTATRHSVAILEGDGASGVLARSHLPDDLDRVLNGAAVGQNSLRTRSRGHVFTFMGHTSVGGPPASRAAQATVATRSPRHMKPAAHEARGTSGITLKSTHAHRQLRADSACPCEWYSGSCASARRSVVLVSLEPDEPVEAVTVDHLPVRCAPRPRLQVVHDLTTFGEAGEPRAQVRGSGGTKQ
jgi:hypothetical protein